MGVGHETRPWEGDQEVLRKVVGQGDTCDMKTERGLLGWEGYKRRSREEGIRGRRRNNKQIFFGKRYSKPNVFVC